MILCVKCDSPIDIKTGLCIKCGHIAFKVDEDADGNAGVSPYLPGADEEILTGRVSPIKYEPIKSKTPVLAIVSNIVLVVGIILLLIFFYFR